MNSQKMRLLMSKNMQGGKITHKTLNLEYVSACHPNDQNKKTPIEHNTLT